MTILPERMPELGSTPRVSKLLLLPCQMRSPQDDFLDLPADFCARGTVVESRQGQMKRKRRYDKEEFARRGERIYQESVRPVVEMGNKGRIVAIDIETGAYEIADDLLTATDRLYAKHPSAQPWAVRIGYPAVHRFGPRTRTA